MSVIRIQSVNMAWGRNRHLFLVSNFRRVLNIVFFLVGESPGSEFFVPTFRNTVYSIFIGGVSTSYEDGTEFSETSIPLIQTPRNHPKKEHKWVDMWK